MVEEVLFVGTNTGTYQGGMTVTELTYYLTITVTTDGVDSYMVVP